MKLTSFSWNKLLSKHKKPLVRFALPLLSLLLILVTTTQVHADQLSIVFFTPRIILLEGPLSGLPLPGGIGDTFRLGGELNVDVAVIDPNVGSASVETDNPFAYFSVSNWPDPEFEFPCGYGTPEEIAGLSAATGGRTLTFGRRAACREGEGYYLGTYSARVTDNTGVYPASGFLPRASVQRLIDADDVP